MNLNRRSMMLGAGGLAALAASPFAAQAARASGKIASVGLQLYTVRALMAQDMGGSLDAANTQALGRRGAAFTLRLPIDISAAQ